MALMPDIRKAAGLKMQVLSCVEIVGIMSELARIKMPEDFAKWSKSFSEKLKTIEEIHNIEPLSVDIVKDSLFSQVRLKEIKNNKSDIILKEVLLAFHSA